MRQVRLPCTCARPPVAAPGLYRFCLATVKLLWPSHAWVILHLCIMQALARLLQTGTAVIPHSNRQQLGLVACTSAQVLWHDNAEQQRCFSASISTATSSSQRGTAATMHRSAHPAQLPRSTWHGLHGVPSAAAPDEHPGQCREKHDQHEHHSHQPSAEATHPAVATAGSQCLELMYNCDKVLSYLQACKAKQVPTLSTASLHRLFYRQYICTRLHPCLAATQACKAIVLNMQNIKHSGLVIVCCFPSHACTFATPLANMHSSSIIIAARPCHGGWQV